MPKKKNQRWAVGDLFHIPLSDGTFSVGQVVGIEPEAMNSAVCAFFSIQYKPAPLELKKAFTEHDLISVLFVTRDLLDSGVWHVFSSSTALPTTPYLDISRLRMTGFVGVKIIGAGIVTMFMEAYFGLYPWNGFYEPDYLDRLLVSPAKKPKHLTSKLNQPTPD